MEMGVLELVDRFRLGRNGWKIVQVQALSPVYYNNLYLYKAYIFWLCQVAMQVARNKQ